MTQQQQKGFNDLPVGFRFHPTDFELVNYYLRAKIDGRSVPDCLIKNLDVYDCDPEDLLCHSFPYRNVEYDSEMYFFTMRRPASSGSKRVSRRAGHGLWDGHATKDDITDPNDLKTVIGCKTQLNFKILIDGNKKKKTKWIMHEYCLESADSQCGGKKFNNQVLCRIYRKKGKDQELGVSGVAKEEEDDDEWLSKRQRVEESAETSSRVYMSLLSCEGVYEPLASSDECYCKPSFPPTVLMTTGVAEAPVTTSMLDNHASNPAALVPMNPFADDNVEVPRSLEDLRINVKIEEEPGDNAFTDAPLISSGTGDHALSSASAVPMTGVADDYDAFAQSLENILPKEVLTTPSDAEYQIPLTGAAAENDACLVSQDDFLPDIEFDTFTSSSSWNGFDDYAFTPDELLGDDYSHGAA